MQIPNIINTPQTTFKASLPKKLGNHDLSTLGLNDFWDNFAAMCQEEGNSLRLQKCLEDLQYVEKDKILAFDKMGTPYYRYPNYPVDIPYYIGLFDSQEKLERVRVYNGGNPKDYVKKWAESSDEYITVRPYLPEPVQDPELRTLIGELSEQKITIIHNGKEQVLPTKLGRKAINTTFFLDLLEKMIKNMKVSVEPAQLIEKFRMK